MLSILYSESALPMHRKVTNAYALPDASVLNPISDISDDFYWIRSLMHHHPRLLLNVLHGLLLLLRMHVMLLVAVRRTSYAAGRRFFADVR